MSRDDVERILGQPVGVEKRDPAFYGPHVETLVYFHRLPPPVHFPMLWVHLRDGKVYEVYAKHHHALDSWGVYVLSTHMDWESPDFKATFPDGSGNR